MGFFLLGTVIWLFHPLIAQVNSERFKCTLIYLVPIGVAFWVLGKMDLSISAPPRWRYRAVTAAIAVVGALLIYAWVYPPAKPSREIGWQTWSADAVELAVRSGKTVFVDFTAAWCSNCEVNKAVAINQPDTADKFLELGVVTFKGDFSDRDKRISAELRKYGRPGVPLNLIYPADKLDDPIVLPPRFTLALLLEKLDEAGPSRAAAAMREPGGK